MGGKWAPEKRSTIEKLLRDHVAITETCWIWTGALKENGYGQVRWFGKNKRAHKLFYECFKDPVPDGLVLDHICRVRRCVNPDHLEPVTPKVNSERGYWAMKTHCIRGHELAGENLYKSPDGARHCRACRSIREGKVKLKAVGE